MFSLATLVRPHSGSSTINACYASYKERKYRIGIGEVEKWSNSLCWQKVRKGRWRLYCPNFVKFSPGAHVLHHYGAVSRPV